MKKSLLKIALLSVATQVCAQDAAPSLEAFDDAIHHSRMKGETYATHDASDYRSIADNIVFMQKANGGWLVNQDPTRILDAKWRAFYDQDRTTPKASFDNRNIYSQVTYLLEAYQRTGHTPYLEAAEKGLGFVFANQIKGCGGWPHTVGGDESYHPKLTIADEVMSGNLLMLYRITQNETPFAALKPEIKQKALAAWQAGHACLLRLQVTQKGVLTGWAGQYDPITFTPSQGRKFELPSIASQESVFIMDYLMAIKDPTEADIRAIESGVAWLERSAIHDTRLDEFTLDPPVRYDYHLAKKDRRLVKEVGAPRLWARFYDLNDNSVVLANRDSVRVERFDQIHPERRTGYAWYGTWGEKLLTKTYPKWKAKRQ